eukprot:Nitzschia sp. Nitz4//scaffold65_size103378//68867//70519//NITZ4_004474-RA/size103378-processed-gene-0.33-mRNA-1//1//CDS//3329556264//5792//frame0
MGWTDLSSPQDLQSFLSSNAVCIVTFSAHWCGPCRASKPQLEAYARSSAMPFGYVYESDLDDHLHAYGIRAFPTYVCFVKGSEVQRVQGFNLAAIQQMVDAHQAMLQESTLPTTGGHALGGSTAGTGAGAGTGTGTGVPVDAAQARALRLARLEAASPAPAPVDIPMEAEAPAVEGNTSTPDATMQDADTPATDEPTKKNPVDDLDPQAIQTLTQDMGFTLLRAQKGLLFATGPNKGTVEGAVEWLMEHQDDDDIDHPIPEDFQGTAKSYKCNDCGKILSNMANLELHANKTGHSDFEESTQEVKPLTPEEKAAKIAEIKELLKLKRAEREEAEKVDDVEREKQRRFMGKEMAKTKEQMEVEQRKREAQARKREKEAFKKERARIRAELEKDKAERQANHGKLHSTLGVDGYNPSAIQYDNDADASNAADPSAPKHKKPKADATKIDEYIQRVSSYRAGGDGAKCLKILHAYIGNLVDHPDDPKFRTINMENKAFKTKVKPFLGGKHLLLAVGFSPKEGDATHLELVQEHADAQLLQQTKQKLEQAMAAF